MVWCQRGVVVRTVNQVMVTLKIGQHRRWQQGYKRFNRRVQFVEQSLWLYYVNKNHKYTVGDGVTLVDLVMVIMKTRQFPGRCLFFTDKVIVQVCCGDSHTVIVTQGGELFTCGRNQNGQLGLGHSFDQFNPNPVPALKNKRIKEAACGAEHTIAVCEDGEVYGWGWGQYGNLGDGERHDRWQPTKVKGLEGIQLRQISCGWRHNLALSTEGVIYVWGWNKYGQLGVADNNDRSTAVPITSGIGQTQVISGGWRYSMSVDQNGDIYAWGWNKFGQLGLGHCEACNTPQKVSSMEGCNIELLACGWRHSMAVSRNGDFYVWGRGSYGRLGLGDEADRMMPTQMEYLTRSNLTNENLIKMQAKSEANQIVPEEEQEFMQVP
eukprot:TRINITY_DN12734_c0_g1_i1.p1 TRINITY_DN12734_c0_g1~~TRINITY_DN12734_c0_g1_i1.p1  ORF type:complete len:379 (-),score=26.38 TRINITY_DN12734_c0_g1_i1:202-1338(-)